MKTTGFSGLVCAALAMFALPAAAQTPDTETPAEETTCDRLIDKTPGLYGLCVAMCEAQDCEAQITPTGDVVFDPSCSPASDELLRNYNKLAGPDDPGMPCVTVSCPCWANAEIDKIGGFVGRGNKSTDYCISGGSYTGLFGNSTDGRPYEEWAYVTDDYVYGLMCKFNEATLPPEREKSISATEFAECQRSAEDECRARGLLP